MDSQLRRKNPINIGIRHFAISQPTLAKMSFFDETKARRSPGGCAIAEVYVSLNPTQIKLFKSMLDKSRQRFMHIARCPLCTYYSVSEIRRASFAGRL